MLKKLMLALFLIGLGGAVIAYYYWTQVTTLPKWYAGNYDSSKQFFRVDEMPTANIEKSAIKKKIEKQIEQQLALQKDQSKPPINPEKNTKVPEKEVTVSLNQQDINQLAIASLSDSSPYRPLLQSVQAIHTDLKKDRLQVGAIVNLEKAKSHQLGDQKNVIIDKAIGTFPQLKDRDIYIAVEGKPRLENGKIILDKDSQVKVGNLSFAVSEIAQQLDIPIEEVQQHLELNINQLNVRDLQINEDGMTLKVSQPE
jgi:hypothetical protein